MHRIVFALLISSMLDASIVYQGLIEEPDITTNTFLCPASAADGQAGCLDQQANMIGFDISGGQTLQFCNNQVYAMSQEATQSQYLQSVEGLKGDELQAKLDSLGWGAMGSYCVIISTNPILTNYIMPSVTPAKNQTKVVAQLWYNGSNMIQLWSQDAVVIDQGRSFKIALFARSDNRLAQDLSKISVKTWQEVFVNTLNIQPNNRLNTDYAKATKSARQIKIMIQTDSK